MKWWPRKWQSPAIFVIDPWFIEDVITHLTPLRNVTPLRNEVLCYLAGQNSEPLRFVTRLLPLQLDVQSPVYVEANAKSCGDAQIEMYRRGYPWQMIAHSHPGGDPKATQPSTMDWEYLCRLQRQMGAAVIGMIVTRSGHFSFYSPYMRFRILILGKGVQEISGYNHVYYLESFQNRPNERHQDPGLAA